MKEPEKQVVTSHDHHRLVVDFLEPLEDEKKNTKKPTQLSPYPAAACRITPSTGGGCVFGLMRLRFPVNGHSSGN